MLKFAIKIHELLRDAWKQIPTARQLNECLIIRSALSCHARFAPLYSDDKNIQREKTATELCLNNIFINESQTAKTSNKYRYLAALIKKKKKNRHIHVVLHTWVEARMRTYPFYSPPPPRASVSLRLWIFITLPRFVRAKTVHTHTYIC